MPEENASARTIDIADSAEEAQSKAEPAKEPKEPEELQLSMHEFEVRHSALLERNEELQSMVETLTQKVTTLNEEMVAVRLRYRDASEEFERATHRIEREARMDTEQRIAKLLLSFLSIVDDLERAIAAAEVLNPPEESTILQGVRLVHSKLLRVLAEHQVLPLDALGRDFDASRFEAIGTMETRDPGQTGKVTDVMEKGYLIGNELLRPAKVVVGKAPVQAAQPVAGAPNSN